MSGNQETTSNNANTKVEAIAGASGRSTDAVSQSLSSILNTSIDKSKIYKDLADGFKSRTSFDISYLEVSSAPNNFEDASEYLNDIHDVMVYRMRRLMKESVKGFQFQPQEWSMMWYSRSGLEGVANYIFEAIMGSKSPKEQTVTEIEKTLFRSMYRNLFLHKTDTELYLDLISGADTTTSSSQGIKTLMGDGDNVSTYLIGVDPEYKGNHEETTVRAPINFSSHIIDHVLNISEDPMSFIHYFDRGIVERDLKILELRRIIIDYLNSKRGKTSPRIKESSVITSAFAYLLELIEEQKLKSQKIRENIVFSQIVGEEVSQTASKNFMESFLKKGIFDKKVLPTKRVRQIIRVAFLRPDLLIDDDEQGILHISLLIAQELDDSRARLLCEILVKRELNNKLSLTEIYVMFLYGLEKLEYLGELNQEMVLWIFHYFSKSEGELQPSDSIGILSSISFEEFMLLMQISEDTLGEDSPESTAHVRMKEYTTLRVGRDDNFPKHRLSLATSTQEGCESVLVYERVVASIREDLRLVPNSFESIHELGEAIIGQAAYKRDLEEIQRDISQLESDPEFRVIVDGHREIVKQDGGEVDQAMLTINSLYNAANNNSSSVVLEVCKRVFTISEGSRTVICRCASEQVEAIATLANVEISEFGEYVDYVITQGYGDDLSLAYDYFIEERQSDSGEVVENQYNNQQLLVQVFGEDYGTNIYYLRHSEDTVREILQTGEALDLTMRQMFAHTLISRKEEIQKVITKNISNFTEKIIIVRQVYMFLEEHSLLPIRNPENFFQYLLLGNHTVDSIEYMIHTLEGNVDSSHHHSEARDCIMNYIKHGKRSTLVAFLGNEEKDRQQDTELEEDIVPGRQRKQKKLQEAQVMKMTLSLSEKRDRDTYSQLSAAIDDPDNFTKIAQEVVRSKKGYHLEVYGYILYMATHGGIKIPNSELINLAHKLESADDSSFSGRGLLQLTSCLQSDIICDLEHRGNTQLINTILRVLYKQLKSSKYRFDTKQISRLIHDMSHLKEYQYSEDITVILCQELDLSNTQDDAGIFLDLLGGLLHYRQSSSTKSIISSLFQNPPNVKNVGWHTLMSIVQKYSLHGEELPKEIQERYEKEKGKREGSFGSIPEKKLYKLVQGYYPYAQHSIFIDGYECDIIVDEDAMMIEYGWKTFHSGVRRRKDKLRDEYFKNRNKINGKQSYQVYRINSDMRYLEQHLLEVLRNYRES